MRTRWLLGMFSVVLVGAPSSWVEAQDHYWPTWGGGPGRTHQSQQLGPTEIDPSRVVMYEAGCEQHINIEVTIDAEGSVYFGTWGLIRSDGSEERSNWSKADGHLYGLSWDLADELWAPFEPATVPLCYDYMDRRMSNLFCPGEQFNGYNGTIEGTGAIGPDGLIYFGRGDGALYALDPEVGEVAWRFLTYNPEDLNDPEGGGEVVAGALIHDDVVYFTTIQPPTIEFETNAIYGVGIRSQGERHWRYPTHDAELVEEHFLAAPALSPDGTTAYFAATNFAISNTRLPLHLYALRTEADFEATDAERTAWIWEASDPAVPGSTIRMERLLVSARGEIFVAGARMNPPAVEGEPYTQPRAVVMKLDSDGNLLWEQGVEVGFGFDGAEVLGFSLREVEGEPERTLYVGQGTLTFIGGALVAIDADSGQERWRWRAADGGTTGQVFDPLIDRVGNLFFNVRGSEQRGAWVVGMRPDGEVMWTHNVPGRILEWSNPVLGRNNTLYFADRAREGGTLEILEPDACPEIDLKPRIYAIVGDPDEPDAGGDTGDEDGGTDIGDTEVDMDTAQEDLPSQNDTAAMVDLPLDSAQPDTARPDLPQDPIDSAMPDVSEPDEDVAQEDTSTTTMDVLDVTPSDDGDDGCGCEVAGRGSKPAPIGFGFMVMVAAWAVRFRHRNSKLSR